MPLDNILFTGALICWERVFERSRTTCLCLYSIYENQKSNMQEFIEYEVR